MYGYLTSFVGFKLTSFIFDPCSDDEEFLPRATFFDHDLLV